MIQSKNFEKVKKYYQISRMKGDDKNGQRKKYLKPFYLR